MPPALADRLHADATGPSLRPSADRHRGVAPGRRWPMSSAFTGARGGSATVIAVATLARLSRRSRRDRIRTMDGPNGRPPISSTSALSVSMPSGRVATVHRPGAAQSELRIGHVAAAEHARLPCAARAEHDPGWPVRQPTQHEPARGQYTTAPARALSSGGPVLRLPDQRAVERRRRPSEVPASRRSGRSSRDRSRARRRAALTRGYPGTSRRTGRAAAQLALYERPTTTTTFVPKVLAVSE